jgi:hypothetical protein
VLEMFYLLQSSIIIFQEKLTSTFGVNDESIFSNRSEFK